MKIRTRKSFNTMLALLAAAALAACGGDDKKSSEAEEGDPNPDNEHFHVGVEGSTFGGPSPLSVKFTAKPFRESGKVFYRWRFDDGTASEEQNPVHTFKRAGYYQVLLEARDKSGADYWNVIIGAWPPKLWEARQSAKAATTPRTIRRLQRGQGLRTAERRKEVVAASRRRANQALAGL